MAILLAFYKVFLEKEQMHVFKRFFLLGAVIIALVIPSLVFVEYIPIAATTLQEPLVINIPPNGQLLEEPIAVTDMDTINWSLLFLTLYGFGVLGFGFRFVKNLTQIIRRIRINPKLRQLFSVKVLLSEKMPPHTFFKYIFLNKSNFEAENIPKEVLLHEETHAKQLHTLDVLFIELLQVILWFNPLIFLFKKSIKLNHEFLADQAVIEKGAPQSNYQNTLLSYISNESLQKYQSMGMASALNYSSIKKRFIIMKKRTSKRAVLLRSILVLPLLALLLYGFSETKFIEVQTTKTEISSIPNSKKASVEQITTYNSLAKKYNAIPMGQRIIPLNELRTLEYSYAQMTPEQRENAEPFPECQTAEPIDIHIDGHGNMLVNGKEVTLEGLPDSLSKINSGLSKTAREKKISARIHVESTTDKKMVKQVEAMLIDYGVATLNIVGPKKGATIPQEGASRKLMSEYDALAKKYNAMDRNHMRILKNDVERLEYIYSLMSDKQKVDAEPFPDFPEPPPAPKALKPAEAPAPVQSTRVLKGEVSAVAPPNAKAPKAIKGEVNNIPVPPLPPEPKAPLDHIIEMAKKGATFFYEDKKISSDKAIELLKKNESLNISTTKSQSKNPQVRISKKPIKIKKSSASRSSIETGNITVNGKELFYSTRNGSTSYFNETGNQVDRQGRLLSENQKENPTFYFNGTKISSSIAHQLLKTNRSIQVTTKNYTEDEYAIVLTDLSKVSSAQNHNKNDNPNSVIDLTDMIAQDALFFYNDEPISAEKALWLTKNTYIERVNTIGSKKGKTKVYLWEKA